MEKAIAYPGKHLDGLRVYSLVQSAKINGVDSELYLKLAALEAFGGRPIPLPHQLG